MAVRAGCGHAESVPQQSQHQVLERGHCRRACVTACGQLAVEPFVTHPTLSFSCLGLSVLTQHFRSAAPEIIQHVRKLLSERPAGSVGRA